MQLSHRGKRQTDLKENDFILKQQNSESTKQLKLQNSELQLPHRGNQRTDLKENDFILKQQNSEITKQRMSIFTKNFVTIL